MLLVQVLADMEQKVDIDFGSAMSLCAPFPLSLLKILRWTECLVYSLRFLLQCLVVTTAYACDDYQ